MLFTISALGLILTPTRELAIQVTDHIKAAAKFTKIDVIRL
jgi:superfamily II DNA/RNA helicase